MAANTQCFYQCLGQGILDDTCASADFDCMCSPPFIKGYQSCISSICTPPNVPLAQQNFQEFCAKTNHAVTLTDTPSAPTSSTTKGMSSTAISHFSGISSPIVTTNPFISTSPGFSLGRIIGAAVGGIGTLLIVLFFIWCIRRRRRARYVLTTVNMTQVPNQNFQPQSPPVMTPQPALQPLQPTVPYSTQFDTTGYRPLYPATFPTPPTHTQGYTQSYPAHPPQTTYTPLGDQTPIHMEYPSTTINPHSFTNVNSNINRYDYPPTENVSQPPQNSTSSYYSSDVKTPLTSTSEQHLLRTPLVQPQSGSSSPPSVSVPPSTQGPSTRPDGEDGATGLHITNLHEMDGSDDVAPARPTQQVSVQPGSDRTPGPRDGEARDATNDAPPVYSETW